ncbi:MAG: hypothetical protein ACERKN_00395 [Velocimicrobium sp.]
MDKMKKAKMDALAIRIRKVKKRRRARRIIRIIFSLMIGIVLLLKFVIGIAYYKGDSMALKIPSNSAVIYLKLSKEYEDKDIVVFKDIKEGKVWMKDREKYEQTLNQEDLVQTRVLGKVICYIEVGGLLKT